MDLDSSDLTAAAPEAPPPTAPRRRRAAGAVASYLVMVFVLVTLNFLVPRAMPGDPIEGLLGQSAATFTFGEQTKAALRAYYKLDGSLASQYGNYLARLAHGDLGRSIATNAPVKTEVGRRLGWTILLIGLSTFLATSVGVAAGIHSGWRRDRPVDRGLLTVLLAVQEFPPYLLGSLLLLVFAVKLHWLPVGGAQEPFSASYGPLQRAFDVGRHLLLPLVVLTAAVAADSYLVMRAGMVGELGSDYLQLGRAKGVRERGLKYRYAARNALLPVVGLTAVELGVAVGADVVIERVFSYPGLGSLLFDSISARDYPTIQGVLLVLALGIVTVNALAEALYRRLDPRTVG